MGRRAPSDESLDTISLKPVKKTRFNPMGLSDPWDNSLDIIALKTAKKKARD